MKLGWVIAYVDDPAAAAAFYEETFGLRTEFVVPGEYAQMDTGTTKLGFATYDLARGHFAGGCEPLSEPTDQPQGQRVGYVRDPFGTLVELATPL